MKYLAVIGYPSIIDEIGIYGLILHYAFVMAFVGSALFAFIYFWYNGTLNMDEEAKFQMMNDEKEDYYDTRQ